MTSEYLTFYSQQLQHPHLQEFCDIDMEMVEVTLGSSVIYIIITRSS